MLPKVATIEELKVKIKHLMASGVLKIKPHQGEDCDAPDGCCMRCGNVLVLEDGESDESVNTPGLCSWCDDQDSR